MNHQNREGLTPLTVAISKNAYLYQFAPILRLLIKNGCDMNMRDNAGRTPLMKAAAHGELEVVQSLLDEGCDINVQDEKQEAMHIADFNFRRYRAKLEPRWQKGYRPCGGHTALMYAVILNEVEIVELLLEKGCDVDLRNNDGHTAIDLARQLHEDEIVKLLEEHGRGGQDALPKSGVEHQI